MTPLRGAIVGCGFFAQFHLDAWRRMEDVEIVAAADPDLSRAQAAAPRTYADLDSLLAAETIDFLDIATRPETHYPLFAQAAAAKVPAVICQKPMAPTLEEARLMADTAVAANVRLMIHENWRFQPWYRELARRLHAGDIGQPVTYRFRIRRNDGRGAAPYAAQPYFRHMPRLLIYETLVHPIDTARYLFGDIASVSARTARRNPLIGGEDFAQILTQHESGLSGIIDGHRFLDLAPDSPPLGDAQVEGESGILAVAGNGDLLLNHELVWKNEVQAGYRGDSVRATQQHFIDCLRTGDEFETTASDYLKTFAVVETAYLSAQEGRTYPV
jgi:predicted dehydrogenase